MNPGIRSSVWSRQARLSPFCLQAVTFVAGRSFIHLSEPHHQRCPFPGIRLQSRVDPLPGTVSLCKVGFSGCYVWPSPHEISAVSRRDYRDEHGGYLASGRAAFNVSWVQQSASALAGSQSIVTLTVQGGTERYYPVHFGHIVSRFDSLQRSYNLNLQTAYRGFCQYEITLVQTHIRRHNN